MTVQDMAHTAVRLMDLVDGLAYGSEDRKIAQCLLASYMDSIKMDLPYARRVDTGL